jgi:hypothetical protein
MVSEKKVKKRKFSGFLLKDALEQLGITDLRAWEIETAPLVPSDFFTEHLHRLRRNFDLDSYEESKKLLIDAICDEVVNRCKRLKIWKGAQLEGDVAAGFVDYLIAERKRYLDTPMLCIIEAKKDDFEQGLAQCLVEMQACQWQNRQVQQDIDVLGIVTNGEGWKFYRLIPDGAVYETAAYSIGDMNLLLGRLNYVFQLCEANLK